MKEYTVSFIFTNDLSKVLLLLKNRGPYPGLLNGVGGHVEDDETPIVAARREIQEETGTNDLLEMWEWMLTEYFIISEVVLHVSYGILQRGADFTQIEDEPLAWYDVDWVLSADANEFAGQGNVQYFIRMARDNEIESRKRMAEYDKELEAEGY